MIDTSEAENRPNQLFLVRKLPPKSSNLNSKLSREEYEALIERMLAIQLKETEQMCDVDENGLETIDLTEDAGVTNAGTASVAPKPVATSMMSMAPTEDQQQQPPDQFFRKAKSNNFFAVDDSLDQIQPFDDDNDAGDLNNRPSGLPKTSWDIDEQQEMGTPMPP